MPTLTSPLIKTSSSVKPSACWVSVSPSSRSPESETVGEKKLLHEPVVFRRQLDLRTLNALALLGGRILFPAMSTYLDGKNTFENEDVPQQQHAFFLGLKKIKDQAIADFKRTNQIQSTEIAEFQLKKIARTFCHAQSVGELKKSELQSLSAAGIRYLVYKLTQSIYQHETNMQSMKMNVNLDLYKAKIDFLRSLKESTQPAN